MSTGLAPVRGALFAFVVAHLGAGIVSSETLVGTPVSPFRLRWLADVGAESAGTDRATSSGRKRDVVLARVPGAAYVLSIENGSATKRRRIAADYSMVYGLVQSTEGDVVIAADDGSINLWSGLLHDGLSSIRWRRDLGERAASVAWDGGETVWVGTRRDRLIALSTLDGETQWSASVGGRVEAPPLPMGDSLFVATKDYTLLRLDRSTGKVRWRSELPGPANHRPVAAGEESLLILASTWNGHLLAVHAETGKTVWTAELGSRLAGAPVASRKFVAVATEDGTICAYDLSGEPLWRTEGIAGERTDLLLRGSSRHEQRLIVVSTKLVILDVSTGEVLDEYPAGAREDIEGRFLDAMLEGERPYSDSEKLSIFERESFPIRGRLFGKARLFGDNLIFGTEEGWIYWFDADSVRPLCRYRAGRRANATPVWAPETLVAASTDAVFGLDPSSGDTLWRRDIETVSQIAAGETLAIVGEDRIDVLDPGTGARQWSARGAYRAVAPIDDRSWLAFTRTGTIQVIDAAGTATGTYVDITHSVEAVAELGEGVWAVASREGLISAVAWNGSSDLLEGPIWEVRIEMPVETLHASGATLVVTGEERVVGLSSIDGSSKWELPHSDGEIRSATDHLFAFDEDLLRVYESDGGTILKELAVESRAVGATIVGDAIVWLDSSGTAHRAPLEGDGGLESEALGAPLSRASFENGSFLVTTRAGEIGLVELAAPPETTLSQPQ